MNARLVKYKRIMRKVKVIWFSMFLILEISILSCVRYPLIVRMKYRKYIGGDTIIFVRKKFNYLEIIDKRCPEHGLECICQGRSFSGSKERWEVQYEVRRCNAKCEKIWDSLFWRRGYIYVIMVDRWGRRIEEGDFTCPYCEGPFVGRYTAYHRNGKVFTTGLKNGGFRCGEWHFYDRRGEIFRVVSYSDDCDR